jgi:hypothetical protein
MESHGDDDVGWGKLVTRPRELSGSHTRTDIRERVGGMDERVTISYISIFDTSKDL